MARFNAAKDDKIRRGNKKVQPIVSVDSPVVRTALGGSGALRDAEGELFLLAVANMVGKNEFHEKAGARDGRYTALIHHVAIEDPDWMGRFLPWLRNEANMRTASIVGALEAARAMVHAKIPGSRTIVNSVLQRADEPGEALGYWMSTYPGRQIPKPIKRGIADAAARLYNEFNTLKYDTESKAFRFGDVLELTHAAPDKGYQRALFKHLIDRRHGRGGTPESYIGLPMIIENMRVRSQIATFGNYGNLVDSAVLKAAGMTWEDVLSLAGDKVPKNQLWEALIPNMGFMALLRNLRNFDEAGVSNTVAQTVHNKLTDPDQVARSRQFPTRFLAAYNATKNNLRWGHALEQGLNLSLSNVPSLPGRTLILVDQSPSMFPEYGCYSGRNLPASDITLADQAKVFGSALALRAESADLIQYGGRSEIVNYSKGDSLLKVLERFHVIDATNTAAALSQWYAGHKKVIILTDEQTLGGMDYALSRLPADVQVITFNVAGYRVGHAPTGTWNRITIGGLTDQAFKLLPVLGARMAGQWPF